MERTIIKTHILYVVVLLAATNLFSVSTHAAETRQNFRGDFPAPPAPVDLRPDLAGMGDAPSIVTGANGTPALRITYDGQAGQNNGVGLNQLYSGGYDAMEVNFLLRVDGDGDNADGFGWAYANSGTFGIDTSSTNPNWGTSEEPNLAGSLGLGFDTYYNEGLDPVGGVNGPSPNSASLHFDGSVIAQYDFSTVGDDLFFESGNPIDVQILATPAGTGTDVTVKLTDTVLNTAYTPFDAVNIPSMNPYDGRMVFRGRTGGADSDQEVDDVSLTITPQGGGAAETFTQDFDGFALGGIPGLVGAGSPTLIGGTPYTAQQSGTSPGAELHRDGTAAGVIDGHLRLAHEVAGNSNVIAFDKTSELNTANIKADFQFRISDGGQLGRADGFSFMLLPTDIVGDSGVDMIPNLAPAEEANAEFALGIGFDTYDSGTENTTEPNIGNHISLHWDNGVVGGTSADCGLIDGCVILDRTSEMDLVNNVWNRASMTVEEVAGGATVSLTVTDGSDGSVHVIFDSVFVDGVEFPQGSRVAFASRTGGEADNFDIDNVLVRWGDETVAGLVCDADGDGDCQLDDLQAMYSQAGTGGSLDLDGSGTIDGQDVDDWLVAASDSSNPGKTDSAHVYLVGDLDLNGSVNSTDLGQLLNNFNKSGDLYFDGGDVNMDQRVDSSDLGQLLNNFGHTSAAAVPEPGTQPLLLMGALLLIRRKKVSPRP